MALILSKMSLRQGWSSPGVLKVPDHDIIQLNLLPHSLDPMQEVIFDPDTCYGLSNTYT